MMGVEVSFVFLCLGEVLLFILSIELERCGLFRIVILIFLRGGLGFVKLSWKMLFLG